MPPARDTSASSLAVAAAAHPRPRPATFRRSTLTALILAMAALVLPIGRAQDPAAPAAVDSISPDELDRRLEAALAARDFVAAEPLLRRAIQLRPRDFVPLFNLACILASRGELDAAMEQLRASIERGFDDVRTLRRDRDLDPLRARADFRHLIESWPRVLEARRDANLARVRRLFDNPDDPAPGTPRVDYREYVDEKRRLIYRTAFDERSFAVARAEIEALGEWAQRELFPDLWKPELIADDPWVIVVLPSRRDFLTWQAVTFGPAATAGFSTIGGAYVHEQKELVSQDLGGTLRHEFFHVLHWRDCVRRGQTHAFWVQEGLASLPEDIEGPRTPAPAPAPAPTPAPEPSLLPLLDADAMAPVPSWRTNIVLRRDRSNTLMPLDQFLRQPRERFLARNQLAGYAQARAIFLWLHQSGRLGEWYQAYTEQFDGARPDPTGVATFEKLWDKPIAQVHREFRAWVRTLPEVAEEIRSGMASLGVEVETGRGDGLLVTRIAEPDRRNVANVIPLRTLRGVEGEIQVGDVIVAVDDRSTRDISELLRVLGEKAVGDEVVVRYSRRGEPGRAVLRLVERE